MILLPQTHLQASVLEFPTSPGFVCHPPSLDPQIMFQRIADTMPWRNKRPGKPERKLAKKVPVEFVL